MSNLLDIQSQIEKLQKQAHEIKTREFDKTVQEILHKMQVFGITTKDLQTGQKRVNVVKKVKTNVFDKNNRVIERKRKINTFTVAPKYRGPNGEGWSGRGLTPRWLVTLIAQGREKSDFAIKSI